MIPQDEVHDATTLDSITSPTAAYTKEERRTHLILLLITAAIFTVLLVTGPRDGGGYDLSGRFVPGSSDEMMRARYITSLVGIPMFSSFIAMFVALLPYRNLLWGKKYERAFYLTMIVVYLIGILFSVFVTVMRNNR